MLSGRGLCDELITRPEESYRLWCVVVCDLETSRIGTPYIYIYIYDVSSLRVNDLMTSFQQRRIKRFSFNVDSLVWSRLVAIFKVSPD